MPKAVARRSGLSPEMEIAVQPADAGIPSQALVFCRPLPNFCREVPDFRLRRGDCRRRGGDCQFAGGDSACQEAIDFQREAIPNPPRNLHQ